MVSLVALVALAVSGCNGSSSPDLSSAAPVTTAAATSSATTVELVPVSSTGQLIPGATTLSFPSEIDIETNITVFFRRDAINSVAEAEAALRELVGDRKVVSLAVVDRDAAWIAANEIANRAGDGFAPHPNERQYVGEVGRIVVTDRDVRNTLTDDIEDSMLVAAVAFVVGVRPAGDGAAELAPDTFEILGFFWTPGSA